MYKYGWRRRDYSAQKAVDSGESDEAASEITFEKVCKTALNILSASQLTEGKLREKLQSRSFPADLVEETIAYCVRKKYIDDETFIHRAVEKLTRKLYGPRKIAQELRRMGFAPALIDEIEFDDGEYAENCLELIYKRGEIDESGHVDRKLFAMLMRAGFTVDQIRDALRLDSADK